MPKRLGTPKVRVNLANVQDDTAIIKMVFRYHGKILNYFPGITDIHPGDFDKKKGRFRVSNLHPTPALVAFNDTLDKVEEYILDIYNEHGLYIEPKIFRERIDKMRTGDIREHTEDKLNKDSTISEVVWYFYHSKMSAIDANQGTWNVYRTLARHLEGYAVYSALDVRAADADKEWFTGFVNYLYAEINLSINQVANLAKRLRAALLTAKDKIKFPSDSYKLFKVKRVSTGKEFALTRAEQNIIANLPLEKASPLDRARDLLLIGLLTGLRWSDLKALGRKHFKSVGGKSYVSFRLQKTAKDSKYCRVPVEPELAVLVNKYNYDFPRMKPQNFNSYIKEVAKLADLDRQIEYTATNGGKLVAVSAPIHEIIASHVCRRSYATIRYVEGMELDDIRQALGHSTTSQTEEYVKTAKDGPDLEELRERSIQARKEQEQKYREASPLKAIKTA